MIDNEGLKEAISIAEQLLKVHQVLVSRESMPSNKAAAYCWLKQQVHLEECLELTQSLCFGGDESINELQSAVSGVLRIVRRYQEAVELDAKRCGKALEIRRVLTVIINTSLEWRNEESADQRSELTERAAGNGRRAQFEYQRTEDSIDFFVVLIWRLICAHSGIPFIKSAIRIFK